MNNKRTKVYNKRYKQSELGKIAHKKYNLANPEKIKARNAARYIKKPKKQLCEHCKEVLAMQKHHEDYTKPLEIIWMCIPCHNIKKEVQ